MRRINKEVQVTLGPDPKFGLRPVSFKLGKDVFRVREVKETWEETGRWWMLEPEETVWRLWLTGGGLVELSMEKTEKRKWTWRVSWD